MRPRATGGCDDRGTESHQTVRIDGGGRRVELRRAAGHGDRLPRPQRLGQVHHHAPDHGAGRAGRRPGLDRRPPLPSAALAAARGRRAAGGPHVPSWPQRRRPSPGPCGQQRHRARPGRRGARDRRARRRRRQARGKVLARHGPAARHRGGATGRPGRAAVRRAGQRAGPPGRPLGAESAQVAGRGGPHGPGVQSPDQRDGAHGRAPGGDRPGAPARRHLGGRADRARRLARGGVPRADRRQHRIPGRRLRRRSRRAGGAAADERAEVMSAATTRLARVPAGHYRLSQVTRMEWIKLRSLRSTIWILAATVASMIAIGILVMANTRAPSSAADKASFDPTNNVLAGLALGETVSFVAFLAGRAVLDPRVPHPAFGQPGVLRAVVMSGAYLCLIGLMGLGLGAIVRHTAGAIAALVGVLFVVPLLLAGITRGPSLAKYFPTFIAGNSLGVAKPVAQMLSPWTGFGVLCLYTAVVLGAGGWLLARRDA